MTTDSVQCGIKNQVATIRIDAGKRNTPASLTAFGICLSMHIRSRKVIPALADAF
jgi:hypothetical protein